MHFSAEQFGLVGLAKYVTDFEFTLMRNLTGKYSARKALPAAVQFNEQVLVQFWKEEPRRLRLFRDASSLGHMSEHDQAEGVTTIPV